MNGTKTVFVYDDFTASAPLLMGTLYIDINRGKEVYSFEYDSKWLADSRYAVNIDPMILPFPGRQYCEGGRIFGIFADASPDRWGRVVCLFSYIKRVLNIIKDNVVRSFFVIARERKRLWQSVLLNYEVCTRYM